VPGPGCWRTAGPLHFQDITHSIARDRLEQWKLLESLSVDTPRFHDGHKGDGRVTKRQEQTPYLDALCEYVRRKPARLHVPGHKGGLGADPGLLEAFGERALSLDIPALTYGIDVGIEPTAFEQAQRLAAEAWGAKRAWFLINGASQGNLAAGLALAHRGSEVVVQRNVHSSTIDALVLSGLRPTFAAPEVDPEWVSLIVSPRRRSSVLWRRLRGRSAHGSSRRRTLVR
jgi:arginine decarboxylase